MAYGFNNDKSKADVLTTQNLICYESEWSDQVEYLGYAIFEINNIPSTYRLISCEYQISTNIVPDNDVWIPLANHERYGDSDTDFDSITYRGRMQELTIKKYNTVNQTKRIRVRCVFVDVASGTEI